MIGRPNFRLKDILWGRAEGLADARNVAKLMFTKGKFNQEQLEYFLKYMEEDEETNKEILTDFITDKMTSSGTEEKKIVFNKSTFLPLMIERLKVRQHDIDLGRSAGLAEAGNAAKLIFTIGKFNQEQLEYFLKRIEEEDEK